MKKDIREVFKTDEEVKLKSLPENHRAEFVQKLQALKTNRSVSWIRLKIAAIFLIALTVGFVVFTSDKNEIEVSPIVAQIEAIEKEYLKNIDLEWNNFVAIANDQVLVERFRKKLQELDADYKEISEQFKADSNNIMVIEVLVDNLQTRLQILKDIQKHIQILNQKNEFYENNI